ncbi:MAG: 3-phenylpropionate/trans-cinnamate dioxygenase ferredoxin reductase subunit [Cyclobacteriaceae bacterium]|jgi:3-phenylpropionate/trans-cinnamate dioxygenase ferredoxin reductase subunit
MSHIVIIGNGISGITAARHIRKKSNDQITVISGETDHFFSRTALMYIYMGHMKYEHTKPYEDHFWAKNKIALVREWVKTIDFEQKELTCENQTVTYDQLILALGSTPNFFGWPGQNLAGVQGLYSFQDLESMEIQTKDIKHAVVVGGGLIGIEMAEMLHSRGIHVTYLVREPHFWSIVLPEGEAKLIDRHIIAQGIDLRLSTELDVINDDGNGRVKSIRTKSGEEIKADFVGLTVGVSPNIKWLKETELETDRGILVDEFLKTNQKDVYAIGDCVQVRSPQPDRRPIETVWYTGRIMGETVAGTLTGTPKSYQPGIWFNSAKFFDIEYQTYGYVTPDPPPGQTHFYWESDKGDKCIRIAYRIENQAVIGINTFGIRMRHEVWERWIAEEKTLRYVIEHLNKANFDPEFCTLYEPQIQKTFNGTFTEMQVPLTKLSFFQKIFSGSK